METSSITPPSSSIAISYSDISFSTSLLLYGIKYPPTFTRGKQYSEITERFDTALVTQKSNFSLYFVCPNSYALACIAVISLSPNSLIT